MDVPVQYFQSVIAIELAVTGQARASDLVDALDDALERDQTRSEPWFVRLPTHRKTGPSSRAGAKNTLHQWALRPVLGWVKAVTPP